jgi:hypothetical protein
VSYINNNLGPETDKANTQRCVRFSSIFGQLLQTILPDIQKANARDRKLVSIGLARVLTQSRTMLNPPLVQIW